MIDTILIVGLVLTFALFVWVNTRRERKIVQAGHCGLPWQSFDMDSQGGVGIKCQRCGEVEWVSWYTEGICTRKWT